MDLSNTTMTEVDEYLEHSGIKGMEWKNHKYLYKIDGRYYYRKYDSKKQGPGDEAIEIRREEAEYMAENDDDADNRILDVDEQIKLNSRKAYEAKTSTAAEKENREKNTQKVYSDYSGGKTMPMRMAVSTQERQDASSAKLEKAKYKLTKNKYSK